MAKYKWDTFGSGKVKPVRYYQDVDSKHVAEIHNAAECCIHFIREHIKIIHPVRGLIPFKLYDYQEHMIENYIEFDRIISMLPRQSGKTISTAAFLLWWAIFKPNQSILIAAHRGRQAAEIMNRIKSMYLDLPFWLKPGLSVNNVMTLTFENGSTIEAETTTANTGRGRSLSILYLDEFAFVNPNIQREFWAAIQPTLSTGGRAIITSTPNTDEDKFAQIWLSAIDARNSCEWKEDILKKIGVKPKEDEDYETVYEDPKMVETDLETEIDPLSTDVGFKRFFAHWMEHPDRDEDFKLKQLRSGMSFTDWNREFECQFVGGDDTLIDGSRIMLLNRGVRKPILVDKHGIRWYRKIQPNKTHIVVLDPSEGVGGDNACLQCWSLPDLKQVGEWAGNMCDPIDQTKMLYRMLRKIESVQQSIPAHRGESTIYYSVESNGVGISVLNMIELEGEEKFPGELIDSDGNKKRGLLTTGPSKRDYALRLKTFIERDAFVPASNRLVSELKTFVKRGKGFEAKSGCKDDRVMACVLACHLIEEIKFYEDGLEEAIHSDLLDYNPDDPNDPQNQGFGVVV